MGEPLETLIVGGGISGLACARRLHEAGRPFVLITDRLGGRMHHGVHADTSLGLGATYVTLDYGHVLPYVGKAARFRLGRAWFERGGRPGKLIRLGNLAIAPAVLRVISRLRELRTTARRFRAEAEHVPQKDLLPKYPLIARYVAQPASELIEELRLGRLHDHYFRLAFRTTCYTESDEANALYYLATLLPVVIPTWVADFRDTYARLTAGFEARIVLDRVAALDRVADGRWQVTTRQGETRVTRNVVLALPYHNARGLYPVPAPHLATTATVLHVRGLRRAPYRGRDFLLPEPRDGGPCLIWRQQGGVDLIHALSPEPDLGPYFEEVEVLARVTWKTAVVLSGEQWEPLALEPGLYRVGDHNLCGLEDSFITGLCAANHILCDRSERWRPDDRGAR